MKNSIFLGIIKFNFIKFKFTYKIVINKTKLKYFWNFLIKIIAKLGIENQKVNFQLKLTKMLKKK